MLGLRPFDVQLIGAMILHKGEIAEMRTGEGKTLVAVLPAYLNALSGKGVHVRSSAHLWSTSVSANAPAGDHHSPACSMPCMLADFWGTYGDICKPNSRAPKDSVRDWKGAVRHWRSPGQQQLVLQGADLLKCRGRW